MIPCSDHDEFNARRTGYVGSILTKILSRLNYSPPLLVNLSARLSSSGSSYTDSEGHELPAISPESTPKASRTIDFSPDSTTEKVVIEGSVLSAGQQSPVGKVVQGVTAEGVDEMRPSPEPRIPVEQASIAASVRSLWASIRSRMWKATLKMRSQR